MMLSANVSVMVGIACGVNVNGDRGCTSLLLLLFPNSRAMESCKTDRRTGAVGSPSELVGGWCPGHVLMASGSCDAGVSVMF